tara:strand:- start:1302 stop:2405 length:1104 start_codon:yes stop_codon:yes gene_type:complete
MIEFLDLNAINKTFKEEIIEAIESLFENDYWINGNAIDKFEKNFSEFIGTKYTVGTSNGFDALRLCLKLKNISHGDEVLVPSFTFIATWLAVKSIGAIPVPVDVNEDDLTLDPNLIENAMTSRTKSIIPVHIFGKPCQMDIINKIGKELSIDVIEDCAQSHGSKFKGSKIGNTSNLCAWSFYPGKNLGALGDAGAITCSSKEEYLKLKAFSNYGSETKYFHSYEGLNARLDTLQAAILDIKLKKLDLHNGIRKKQAEEYFSRLDNIQDLKLLKKDSFDFESVWHLFPIRTSNRDNLKDYLHKKGVNTLIHYPVSIMNQEAFSATDFSSYSCPIGNAAPSKLLSLPIGPHLTLGNIKFICDLIEDFYK